MRFYVYWPNNKTRFILLAINKRLKEDKTLTSDISWQRFFQCLLWIPNKIFCFSHATFLFQNFSRERLSVELLRFIKTRRFAKTIIILNSTNSYQTILLCQTFSLSFTKNSNFIINIKGFLRKAKLSS